MNTLLFNVNDLALLLQVAQCGLLTIILLLVRDKAGSGNGLLALLLVAFSLRALDTLIYWSLPTKEMVAALGVWPFWLLKWAPLALGPLLYAYIRTKLIGVRPSRKDWPHGLPLLIYPFVVLVIVWQLGPEAWQAGVYDFGVWYQSKVFHVFSWLLTLSALGYGVYTLWFLRKSVRSLENTYSNPANVEPMWLHMVVWGYVILWGFALLARVAAEMSWQNASHILGLANNYLSFAFITSLVFYSLLKSQLITPVTQAAPPEKHNEPTPEERAAAAKLHNLLLTKELYLNPELTVEQFAQEAGMTDRQVSHLINACLGKNFFELVNAARVEKSKEILTNTDWSILRVLDEAGFNSKATFNRIFKRYAQMTPTEYRKAHRGQATS